MFAGLDLGGFSAGRELLKSLLMEVEDRRRRQGVTTFSDLLSETARLFTDHPDVCRAERQGMDQLLVDEFQDTDTTQCSIVRALALDGSADRRPGLFVVGDPKQSIYAWRSADLAAYDGFVKDLEASGGVRGPLTCNFRSVLPILDEVERVVEPVMQREEGYQPVFEALEATDWRANSPGFDQAPWTAVEHWVTWPGDDDGLPAPPKRGRSREVFDLEARAIATDIRRLHDEAGVAYGDVAVLLRATTEQDTILEAFRTLGIPFDVARERNYYEKREIVEAAALIRTILEPADLLALLTVIRSDAVGVPDAALGPLWDALFPAAVAKLDAAEAKTVAEIRRVVDAARASMAPAPGSAALGNWPDALVSAMENLAVLRRSAREEPPDLFVERLRTLWLAEVSAAARYLGRFRQARLEAFYTELEKTLTASSGGGAEIARLLRRSVDEGREAPTASEPNRDADAVHMMTIYGAKGLDFEHVYLAQIHKMTGSFGRSTAVFRRWDSLPAYALFGWQTPCFRFAEDRRKRQERAERVRLLYVGMTRAKQRLVLSGGWSTPGNLILPENAATLADLVAHRGSSEYINDLIDRRIDREAGPDPGVSWFLPQLADPSWWETADGIGVDSETTDRGDEAAEAAIIAQARDSARQRMEKSWTVAASDASHRSNARVETELEGESETAPPPVGKSAAAAVGTAIHHFFETLDLTGDLAEQVGDRRALVIDDAVAGLDDRQAREAAGRIEDVLDRLPTSCVLKRLSELAPMVIARELPVFLRPDHDDGASVITGSVDLVYSDPDDGRLAVADYKTDRTTSEAEIAGRVERYRPQLETYAKALEQALDLDVRPRTELWFLDADRIVRLS
jgi:ATP-dependent helicase/nuclease subunit A